MVESGKNMVVYLISLFWLLKLYSLATFQKIQNELHKKIIFAVTLIIGYSALVHAQKLEKM